MNILILTHGSFPPDIRIEKEVIALTSSGFKVHVVADQISTKKKVEEFHGAMISYIPMFFPLIFPIVNFGKLLYIARAEKPSVIQVCDAPLGLVALLLSRFVHAKLVYDAHEIWPYLGLASEGSPLLKIASFLIYFFTENFTVRAADAVITVCEEAAAEIQKLYACQPKKIYVVGNYPDMDDLSSIKPRPRPSSFHGYFIITYVGGLEKLRGLENIIAAVSQLPKSLRAKFVVVGYDRKRLRSLKALANRKNGADRFLFTGYLPFEEAMQYVFWSDLCILPHLSNRLTEVTIPHKIFQYTFYSKPVLCTPLRPIVRLLDGAVSYVPDTSPRSWAIGILEMHQNRTNQSSLAHDLIERKLNWKNEELGLLQLYEHL